MSNKRVIDVDKYLQDQGITIKFKGKEYFIDDIPQDVQEILSDPEKDNRKAIALLLGVDEEEVKDLGLVKIAAIVNLIYENLLKDHVSAKGA